MKFLKNITASNIFKLSSLNALSVVVRILGGVIGLKLVAKYLGPGGMAITGNFRSFLTSLEAYSTLGIQNGVVKYVGEYHKDRDALSKTLSTIFIAMLAGIIVLSTIIYFTAGYWNILVFDKERNYTHIFKITALSLPWFAGNVILLAIVNGLGFYKEVIKINIISNVAGVIVTALLIWKLSVTGAMLALIITPAFVFIMSLHYIYKHFTGLHFFKFRNFDGKILKGLLNYSFMALVSALIGPFVILSIRKNIINHFSENEAGFWDTMIRISVFYLMFVTTFLSIYFFPRLAKSENKLATGKVFTDYFKLIVPLYLAGSIVLYMLKSFVIKILSSDDFLPVTSLSGWQLLGDFFKVCSMIFAYEFFAKKLTKTYIATEIVSYGTLYFSGMYLTQYYGSEGAVMAHVITYFTYLLVLMVYFRKTIF